jgi:hypothetical protein
MMVSFLCSIVDIWVYNVKVGMRFYLDICTSSISNIMFFNMYILIFDYPCDNKPQILSSILQTSFAGTPTLSKIDFQHRGDKYMRGTN